MSGKKKLVRISSCSWDVTENKIEIYALVVFTCRGQRGKIEVT